MSLVQELEKLDLSQLASDERWALMKAAEKAAIYVVEQREAIRNPEDARALVFAKLQNLEKEVFLVVFLSSQNEVLCCEPMFHGTIDSCAVHPREVVKKALECNAAGVLLAHNHPSGNSEPSAADRAITTRLVDALRLIDVRVVDHLVVAEGRGKAIASFAERGWL